MFSVLQNLIDAGGGDSHRGPVPAVPVAAPRAGAGARPAPLAARRRRRLAHPRAGGSRARADRTPPSVHRIRRTEPGLFGRGIDVFIAFISNRYEN